MLHKLAIVTIVCSSLLFGPACGKSEKQEQPQQPPPAQQSPESQPNPATQPAQPPQPAEPGKQSPAPEARKGPESRPEKRTPPREAANAPQAKPAPPAAAEKPEPKSALKPPAKPIVLKGAPLGGVRFEHAKHAFDCDTCHHPSRAAKPAAAPQQACTGCHTTPPQPGMKTSRQAAFHNPTATAGTCLDCHKKSGGTAPTRCMQCHRKEVA